MNDKIVKFIHKQTCASVCCVETVANPYSFSCFYAFNAEAGLLYFKSSMDTRHGPVMVSNPHIAGTILPDKLNIMLVKGIQFEGIVLPDDHPSCNHAASHYYKKFPMALAMHGEIWTIQLNYIKMTDSTLGFGKKIEWTRAAIGAAS